MLDALSANHTHLVLTHSGLAVGGAYIPDTNHTRIIAIIRLNGGEGVGVTIGEGGGGGDVEVDVKGAPEGGTVQVSYCIAGNVVVKLFSLLPSNMKNIITQNLL